MFDKNELKAMLARNGENQGDLANMLGLTSSGLSVKVNGIVDFKRNEIELMILRYKLSPEDVQRIFFAPNVTPKVTATE